MQENGCEHIMKILKVIALVHPFVIQIFFYIHFMNPRRISYVTSALYIPCFLPIRVPATRTAVFLIGILQFGISVLAWAQIIEILYVGLIYIYVQSIILVEIR